MHQRAYAASPRLSEVRYEIRGELAHRARDLEARGQEILRLNIGNPGVYGFSVPAHLREAIERNLARSEAYCVEQGLNEARAAIVAQQKRRGALQVAVETTFIGNGVSELIDIALRALLAPGDEVLVPSPDYPLWTASTILNGGTAVHYECSAGNGFLPDPDALEAQIGPRTRALVVINPNNPTGAVYPRALLERLADIATRHRLVLMCDEIYDQVLYDDATFEPMARLAPDTLVLTLSGLSKVHRACGYRVGWLSLSGDVRHAQDYVHGLVLLAALRLCSNVTAQWAIVPALTGPDTISELTRPGGRMFESRRAILDAVARSRFLSVSRPAGALYAFPGIDTARSGPVDDHAWALDLLETENVLLVPGSSFNVPYRNHFRVTVLPQAPVIAEVFARIERSLERHAARHAGARQVAVA
ncbi:MAG: aminotransferase class I/II-fold pyridoxal phosphate-dependent enzyme [Pseudomonadota bacterium]